MIPTFTALSSAWLFLLAVPLIIFYFLKLRRPRMVIPSLVLWRQVIADQRVNSPFQRFKRNILLLLQLLLLGLLVLAAMQPVIRRQSTAAVRLPVLIDVSASMAALDQPRGISRLDAAKLRVRELIDHLPPDQEVSLIAFAKTARRLTSFTTSKIELRDALDALAVEDVAGDLDEALRLAQAIARTAPFDRLWLISDGNFPARTQFELSFAIDFQRVAPAGSNFGITTLGARRAIDGQWEVFVQLAGSAEAESTTGTVELRREESLIASERVTLAKGSAPRLGFRLDLAEAALIEARFAPEGFDSLQSDNIAWLSLPTPRPLAVAVPESLPSVRHALAALSAVEIHVPGSPVGLPAFDLLITDREGDLDTPARILATFALVPREMDGLLSIAREPSQAIDWRRDSPALQHVSFDDVIFSDQPRRTADDSETRVRELGYETLAESAQGPLILENPGRDQWRVAALFHPDRSTLVYRVGFPVFISNLVQMALRQAQLSEVEAAQTGVLPAMRVAPDRSFEVHGPGGVRRVSSDPDGSLSGIPAPKAGEYRIEGAGSPIRLGAALLSQLETSLVAVEEIEFAEQLKVAATSTDARADRSLWWLLACAALGFLALEWWWSHRRPQSA
jgi:Ca-activated chloride channel family protein